MSVLKSLASFLFYSIWTLILLDVMVLVLIGAVFVTKTAIEDLFGCDFTKFMKKKNSLHRHMCGSLQEVQYKHKHLMV